MTITVQKILKIVADYYDIRIENVKSLKQDRDIITVRYLTMYFARQYTRETYRKISSYFPGRNGEKNHATVMHGTQTINNLIETDKNFRKQVFEIDQRIKDFLILYDECFYENDSYAEAVKIPSFKAVRFENKYGNHPVKSAIYMGYKEHAGTV